MRTATIQTFVGRTEPVARLTASDLHEVAAWIRRWRPAEADTERQRIVSGHMVFDADAVRKLILK